MQRFLIFIFICLSSKLSLAKTIQIKGGNIDPIPFAITSFQENTPNNIKYSKHILSVIQDDLKSSGIFKPVSSAAFIEKSAW